MWAFRPQALRKRIFRAQIMALASRKSTKGQYITISNYGADLKKEHSQYNTGKFCTNILIENEAKIRFWAQKYDSLHLPCSVLKLVQNLPVLYSDNEVHHYIRRASFVPVLEHFKECSQVLYQFSNICELSGPEPYERAFSGSKLWR